MAGQSGDATGASDTRRLFTRAGPANGSYTDGDTVTPDKYFAERFSKFLTNEWVHLERKVAALEAKVHLILGMLSALVGLIIYLVVES